MVGPNGTPTLDGFGRPDADPAGGNWTYPIFPGDNSLAVSGGRLIRGSATAASWGSAYWNPRTFSADCECWAEWSFVSPNNPIELCLRVQDSPGTSTVDGYMLDVTPAGVWSFWKIANNIQAQVGASGSQAVAAGDKIAFSAVGSTLTAYYSAAGSSTWTPVKQVSDSSFTAGGNLGLVVNQPSNTIASFGGGDVPVLTSPTVTAVLDDANRANTSLAGNTSSSGAVYGNAGITGAGNVLQVASNQIGAPSSNGNAYLNANYGPDLDFYMDVPVLPTAGSYVFLAARIQNPGVVAWNGYGLIYIVGTGWQLRKYVSGSSTVLGGTVNTNALVAGDKVWLALRGTALVAFRYVAAASVWVEVTRQLDATYASAGKLGFELGDTTVRVDNVSGGTYSAVTFQYQRPSSDVAAAGWTPQPTTPASLYDKVDEAADDDADYIWATAT